MANQIIRALDRIEKAPAFIRPWLKDKAIGAMVPMIGRAKIHFVQTKSNIWEATLANHRRVGNHLGQVHAAGMILLAETLGVMIMAYNLPDDRIPLVKHIDASFVKRSSGGMHAKVELTAAQVQYIQDNEKGEMPLEVTVTDEAGNQPILITITSAWVPKVRKN